MLGERERGAPMARSKGKREGAAMARGRGRERGKSGTGLENNTIIRQYWPGDVAKMCVRRRPCQWYKWSFVCYSLGATHPELDAAASPDTIDVALSNVHISSRGLHESRPTHPLFICQSMLAHTTLSMQPILVQAS